MAVKSYADYAREQLGVQDGAKLSTYQKQKNRASYQKYVNDYLAEQQKNESLAEIKKNKETALSESAIASERARQYVNAVNQHYGIAGTGYAQSKAIDLYSQEAKRRAEINNAHSAQENEALKAYQQAIANSALAENEALGNIELAEDQENEAKRQSYVETLRQVLEQRNSEEGLSDKDFSRYYTEYAKHLGEDDALLKQDLDAVISGIDLKNAQEQVRAEVAKDKGILLGEAISLEELVNDKNKLGSFSDTGEQTALINAIITAAKTKGVDSLEGKAFDANFGTGKAYYVYKNGSFFKISKDEAKKYYDIVEINNDGSIKLVSQPDENNQTNRYAAKKLEKMKNER